MALSTKVGSFAKINTTGTQAITGVGFTPKAIIFWTSGSKAASGTWEPHVLQTIGFTTGASNSYAVAGAARDGVSTSNTARRMSTKAIDVSDYNGSATAHDADLSSFDADGFTLNWTTNAAHAERDGMVFNYLALGGSDITGAKVVSWTAPTASGNKAVTGVGFKPDLALHMSAVTGVGSSSALHYFGFGSMNKHGQQWANSLFSHDAQTGSNTSRWQQTDACLLMTNVNEGIIFQSHFASMDADGFTTNFSTAPSSAYTIFSLCLQGVSSKIGAFAKTTAAAPATQAITRTGFTPKAALLSSFNTTANGSPITQAFFNLGASDGVNERVASQLDIDANNPTQADSIFFDDKVFVTTTGGPLIGSAADLTTLDSDGFTLNWTTNNSTATEILYLALGDTGKDTTPSHIATSTATTATAYSNQRKIDRTQNGVLWAFYYTPGSTNAVSCEYSTDNGTTWTAAAGPGTGTTTTTYVSNSSIFIDVDDYAHVVFKDPSNGWIYYWWGTPNAGRTAWTWSAATAVVPNTTMDYPDIVAHKEGTGWKAHIVLYDGNYVSYARVNITSSGTISVESGPTVVGGSYGNTVAKWPSIDFNHTGDGKTVAGSTPHLYAAWSAGATGVGKGIRFKKATYSGGSWTWGTDRDIDTGKYLANSSENGLNCLFDGTRVMIAGYLYNGSTYGLSLWERDAADTTTTNRVNHDTSLTNYGFSSTYDGSGHIYLFGGDSTEVFYRRWNRTSTTLETKVPLGPSGSALYPFVSAKRGYSSQRIEWIHTSGNNSPYSIQSDTILLNQNPSAPTLSSPANSSTTSLSGTPTFKWVFNDPDTSDTQSAYYFRRKISGAGSYEYWNASTSGWQSTEVKNSLTANNGATVSLTFPSGTWTNGNVYNWSVKVEDNLGAASAYASDFTVTAGTAPTVTVTAPSGTFSTSTRPQVTWSYSDAESDPQTKYQVKVESGSYGTTPGSGTSVHDSGVVTDSAGTVRSYNLPVDLDNGTTYRFFVQSTQSGNQTSAWAYSTATISLDPPATPTITATADNSNSRVTLTVQGRDNLLTTNQGSIETDTTGWAAGSNTSIARSTAQATNGSASLSLTSAAAGNVSATTPTGTSGVAVAASKQYTAVASFRSAASARSARVDIGWYTSAGSLISTSTGSTITTTTTGWTQATLTATSPSTAAFAAVVVTVLSTGGASEVHYVDAISLAPGSSTTWTRGGLSDLTNFDVEYSDDGGVTWTAVRGGTGVAKDSAANQQATVYDYESPPNTARTYRAKTRAEI